MPQLKLPANVGAVSHGTFSFTGDEAGIIDTGDAPAHVVHHLIKFAGCREATDADYAAADEATVQADLKHDAKAEKAALVEKLKGYGVTVDGRATIANLRKMLAEHEAAAPAAAAPAPAPEKKANVEAEKKANG